MNKLAPDIDYRVLLLAPTSKDAAFSQRIFGDAGIHSHVCQSVTEVCEEATRGAGLLLLAQEALLTDESNDLAQLLSNQPAWSDLPVLLLVTPDTDSMRFPAHLRSMGLMTYIKRPVEVVALISSVQAALRDRVRQYEVREHLVERERQATSLFEADRRKDEFLATLAHELRNPLAPLRAGIDLLLLNDDSYESRQETLQVMDRQLQQMVRLVDDLLDVSRITRDKLTLRLERVELQRIVQNSVEATRQLIDGAGLNLTVTIPTDPVYLRADLARMSQVLSNLLNNAAKYSESGGKIELRCEVAGDHVQIEVSDTGIGIPAEMLSKIFEMFSQVDASLNRSRGGLGIGLTIVRRLIEMHGGRVSASSNGPGTGSRFIIELPMATPLTPEEAGAQTQTYRTNAVQKRVMVVDDTRAARVMLGKLLEKLGQKVWVVDGGAEALRQFEQIQPDLVFSDIGMPEMNGYELAQHLRLLPACKNTVLIALTGYGQEQDRVRAKEAGFDHHLVKPVNLVALREALTLCRT